MTITVKMKKKERGKRRGRKRERRGDMQFTATEHNVKSIFLYKNVKGNKANNIKCYY